MIIFWYVTNLALSLPSLAKPDPHTHLEVIDIVGLADTAEVITISSFRKCPSATRPGGRGTEHTYSASAKPLIHSMGTLRLPHQQ